MGPRKTASAKPRFDDLLSREIVEHGPNALCAHASGVIIWANTTAIAMTGASCLGNLVGHDIFEFVAPEDREDIGERLVSFASGSKCSEAIDFRLVRQNGTSFAAQGVSRMLEVDGSRVMLTVIQDISTLTDTMRALRESEERYRMLVDLSPDIVFVHSDGVVVYANQTCVRAAGGSSATDLVGLPTLSLIAPPSRGRSRVRVQHVLDQREPLPAEVLGFERLDGTSYPVEVVAMPTTWAGRPAVQVIGRNLADREAADRALAESEARYRTLVEMLPDSILVHDGETIFYANEAGLRLYGAASLDDLAGEPFDSIIDPDYVDDSRTRIAAMIETGEPGPPVEGRHRRLDGGTFDAEVIARPIIFEDRPAILAMARDTTERKQVESELTQYRFRLEQLVDARTSELIESNNQLAAATAAKDSFLAAMSHELRTPLNSIIGFSGVMAQGLAGPLGEEQARQVGMINRSGKKLLGLVDDMLDLTRIEAGKVDVTRGEVSLGVLSERLRETIEPLARGKGLALILPPSEDPTVVWTDGDKLEQILLNFLTNAVKNTDRGEVELAFTAADSDGEIRMSVRDTGQGIPAGEHERIFQDFHQLPSSTEAKRPGTGLGLAIVRRLAGLLGGRVELESVPGEGSTFTLVLPV